jgi:hypothetical protein
MVRFLEPGVSWTHAFSGSVSSPSFSSVFFFTNFGFFFFYRDEDNSKANFVSVLLLPFLSFSLWICAFFSLSLLCFSYVFPNCLPLFSGFFFSLFFQFPSPVFSSIFSSFPPLCDLLFSGFIAREQCRFFQPLIAGVMVARGVRWTRWTTHPHKRCCLCDGNSHFQFGHWSSEIV